MSTSELPNQVMPLRYVPSVDAVRDFYIEKLGFEHYMGVVGDDGALDFCIVHQDGATMMISRPEQPDAITVGPLEIFVQSRDVDAYHAKLSAAGVTIARALETQWWGDRTFGIVDPAGHLIWFWQTVAEMQPPPGVKLV
jgi:uncharacterized glyoxalase superfamily protein PhnB